MWYEELPDQCPPKKAVSQHGKIFYRLVNQNPAIDSCFLSRRAEGATIIIAGEITECIARAVSIWETESAAKKKLKLPALRTKLVAKVTFNEEDGSAMPTFGKGHHSWWRTKAFIPTNAEVII